MLSCLISFLSTGSNRVVQTSLPEVPEVLSHLFLYSIILLFIFSTAINSAENVVWNELS